MGSMKQFGIYLAIFGAASFVLNMMHLEFRILSWIDSWGRTTGIAIRIGLIVLGAVVFFIGMKRDKAAASE